MASLHFVILAVRPARIIRGRCRPWDNAVAGGQGRPLTNQQARAQPEEARRAFVLHDQALVVGLIQLTLNHGLFVVRAAQSLAEADAILADWRPDLAVIDMEHDDSSALLGRLGASNTMRRSTTPILGLTRRGDLRTKLEAFDLGVDDILTVPFSPE